MNSDELKQNWRRGAVNIEAETAAWDSAAEEYVFEEKINFRDEPFLRFMAEKTEIRPDMRSLDVGCGAGAYSVALAGRVAQADGLDLSPRMVELGMDYARKHGIGNLSLRVADWGSLDETQLGEKYDIVFAHTTPAVADYDTLMKMCAVSRGCCFLCKPARRTDKVFDALRELAGLKKSPAGDDSVAYTFAALWGLGYEPELSYTKTVWLPERRLEDAEKWFIGRLRGRETLSAETETRLKEYLRDISVDGLVKEEINTTLVNIYWKTV